MNEFSPFIDDYSHLKRVSNGDCRPLPLKRQRLSYDGKLTHKGIEQVEPDEFKRLIFEPRDADPVDLARWKVEHKKKVTNLWLDAQCKFYGLYSGFHARQDRIKDLRKWLSSGRVSILMTSNFAPESAWHETIPNIGAT